MIAATGLPRAPCFPSSARMLTGSIFQLSSSLVCKPRSPHAGGSRARRVTAARTTTSGERSHQAGFAIADSPGHGVPQAKRRCHRSPVQPGRGSQAIDKLATSCRPASRPLWGAMRRGAAQYCPRPRDDLARASLAPAPAPARSASSARPRLKSGRRAAPPDRKSAEPVGSTRRRRRDVELCHTRHAVNQRVIWVSPMIPKQSRFRALGPATAPKSGFERSETAGGRRDSRAEVAQLLLQELFRAVRLTVVVLGG